MGSSEVTELDVDGVGDVAGGPFAGLANVEHRPGDVHRVHEGDGGDGQPGAGPGGQAAIELAEDGVVADGEALADEVGAVDRVVEHEHDGPVEVDEPAEPAGEHRAVLDRDRPGGVRPCEGGDRAGVDEGGAVGEVLPDGVEIEAGQVRYRRVQARADAVQLGELGEVVGEGPEASHEGLHESVLVVDPHKRVGGSLDADGGRPRRSGRRRAEGPGAMGRVHRQVIGQRQDLGMEGPEQVAGEVVAALVAEQIGPAHRAHHERPTREQPDRFPILGQQIGEMVGGVAGRRDCPQRDRWRQGDGLAGGHRTMGELERRAGRREERGAVRRELGATRHVIGMGVGVSGPRHLPPVFVGHPALPIREPRRVDHQSRAVAKIDDVGRMAEPLVHHAHDLHHDLLKGMLEQWSSLAYLVK